MYEIALDNLKSITKDLKSTSDKSEKILKRIVNDFKSRAPSWVATQVTQVYGINKKEIMPNKKDTAKTKKAGMIRARGRTIDSVQLIYRGRVLTPTHFKMKPGSRPLAKIKEKKEEESKNDDGKKKKEKKPPKYAPYEVTAEIYKGQRKVLGSNVFLAGNKGGGQIPFVREGRGRMPIMAVKTVSVPQMIDNEDVKDKVVEAVNKGIGKRMIQYEKWLAKNH